MRFPSPVTLPRQTARLLVRDYAPADLDDVARILAHPDLALGGDEPLTREQSRVWLDEEIEHARRDGTGRYAVVLRASGEVVGGCGLVRRELEDGVDIEIGYHLRRDLWGRGLATEAAVACVAEALERGVPHLLAFIDPGNERSQAVARHLGMRLTGVVEWFGRPHQRWVLTLP